MDIRARAPGLLFVGALLALAAAYAALLMHAGGSSPLYRAAAGAGAIVVIAAAVVTLLDGPRTRLVRLSASLPTSAIVAAGLAPWLALCAVIMRRGLWWTQRPASLRLFVALCLVTWTVWLCARRLEDPGPLPAARRAAYAVAIALWIIGIQGLAFGIIGFGCAVSAMIAVLGAAACLVAALGGVPAAMKLVAASVAAMLSLGAGEAGVRLLHIGQNVQEVDHREFARQFYSLTPPRSAFLNQPKALDEFAPALIEINSLGIRGPEIPTRRADWLLIGDSMIEARQLPWEQTIAARIQEALRARALPVSAVSHGMRGWSPLLEWNWYLKVGRQLHPRVVFLFFFWNDLWTEGEEATTYRAVFDERQRPVFFDVAIDSEWIWYKHVRLMRISEDVWTRAGISQLRRAVSSVAQRPLSSGGLDDAAAERMARSLTDPPMTPQQIEALMTRTEAELPEDLRAVAQSGMWPTARPLALWTERQRRAAARTESELQRFAEDVRADGARFVIVSVPNPMQVGPRECSVGRFFERLEPGVTLKGESGIQTWLRSVADRHGFELVDPLGAMQARYRDTDPFYLRADCHWSARGHQFMADLLVERQAAAGEGGASQTP